MRLRRVVLSGFKTFARRTEVGFEPGITAVVGPNGSGKSNLVDAIRWALGETSARELRGSRMDEVIYTGGEGRGRMGVAEVELVIDNEEGVLPVEDVEVAVSRRVVRGGDIEYRINSERARLRDLERLLGATGLTQSGYAVVSQHDIDAIIEATPRQRRALVEQAAGVRPLRVACEDALNRIGHVDIAVQRLLDRLDEAEPRLEQLWLEAGVALEQRGLGGRLAELRGSLAREEWRAARAELRNAGRRLDTARRRLEAVTEADAALTERLGRRRAELEAGRRAQRDAADHLESVRLGAERAAGERRRWADRCITAVLHRAGARAELADALSELAAAQALSIDLAGSDLGAAERGRQLQVALADLGERCSDAESSAQEAAASVAAAESALAGAADSLLTARASAGQVSAQLSLFDDAAQVVETEISGARRRLADLTAVAAATEARCSHIDGLVAAAAATVEAQAARAASSREDLSRAEAILLAASEAARGALARAASLHGQVEGALGGGGAIAGMAAELGAERLVDAIRVLDQADAAAIEAALEPHLGAWVVDDLDRAAALLSTSAVREEALSSGAAGAASPAPPAGARAAIEAVEVTPRIGAAAAYCMSMTWLAPDLTTARRAVAIAGGRAVLPDGTVVTTAGIRGGGGSGDTLALVAAARAASVAAAGAEAAEVAAAAELRRIAETVTAADASAALAARELASARAEHADANAASSAAQAAAAAEVARLTRLEAELSRREGEKAALTGVAATSRAHLEAAIRAEAQARTELQAARDIAANQRGLEERLAAERRGLELKLLEFRQAAAEMERRRREAEHRRSAADQRVGVGQARVAAAETDALIAIARGREVAVDGTAAAAAVLLALERLQLTAPPLLEIETEVAALEQDRSEVIVAVARAEDEAAGSAVEVDRAQARVAQLALAIREEIEDETVELDPEAVEKAEREIARLERRIAAMGPVNALAPEQHAALLERVGALRDDRADLSVAAAEIRNLARRLSGEAGRRFEAVFGAVGVHFGSLFGQLFPGGRAALRMEEPAPAGEDDTTTPEEREQRRGIEILAQPAGKKLQPLAHLSGGERALTSMAVIFALQQVNPSPFYVFDEVDAPLDDSNVLRFTRLLTRLAQTQQFIVITHNHVTMAAADALYGVTIDREGISSVLSVRFAPEDVPVRDVLGVVQAPLRRTAS